MQQAIRSQIEGTFSGFNGDAVFKLTNGQIWQQSKYKYRYHYAYRPRVTISKINGQYFLEIDGLNDGVPVTRVSEVLSGVIVSDFNGFDGDSIFEFENGEIWKQAEYNYDYHYAYRPEAIIISGPNGTVLHVEGMSETVSVERIR